ncbi:MAG: argininosuccinate lyase [Chloroflexota bacterium]|nr:MAG: argininosuccinate lyase [Chloroflexota bacterium]
MTELSGHLGLGDRLKEGPAPELIASAFALEAGDGPLLYEGMSLADLAHAVMLVEIGLIPPEIGAKLLAVLLELHAIPAAEFPFNPARGDAYNNREYVLRQQAPEVAGWLQAGRPRREVTTIAYLLVVRECLLALTGALLNLMMALLDMAEAHLHTLMPDYTYLQTAHPTTLAHYLLTFVQPMTRDLARLCDVFERTNLSPAGSGSTNGSRLPLDRVRLAELLGFAGLVLHTRDAMWQPDGPIEVLSTAVALLANADRLAEDLQLWATAEFNFIELADRHSRISVIMPHKKNPYSLAFVRGVAREMIGRLASAAAHQVTPSGQIDNRIFAYGGAPLALEQTRQAVQLLAGTLAGLTVNKEVMAQRAKQSYGSATDLAEFIMLTAQIDANTAHRIVGQAVRAGLQTGQPFQVELLDLAANNVLGRPLGLSEEQLAGVLDTRAIVETRIGPGGAAPQAVQGMLTTYRNVLGEMETWQAEMVARLAAATARLLKRAQELAD